MYKASAWSGIRIYHAEGTDLAESERGAWLISAAIFMLLSFVALLLSLLRVGKFMWNSVYFRTTAVSPIGRFWLWLDIADTAPSSFLRNYHHFYVTATHASTTPQ